MVDWWSGGLEEAEGIRDSPSPAKTGGDGATADAFGEVRRLTPPLHRQRGSRGGLRAAPGKYIPASAWLPWRCLFRFSSMTSASSGILFLTESWPLASLVEPEHGKAKQSLLPWPRIPAGAVQCRCSQVEVLFFLTKDSLSILLVRIYIWNYPLC